MSEAEKRIKQLSEKVRLTSEERDEKDNLVKERDIEIVSLKTENSFNSGFADVLGNHPAAKDFKDDIKTKVLAGYSVEDATFAVLGKAGKLGAPATRQDIAGGSADTTITGNANKEIKDMSLAEKRGVLAQELTWS